MPSTPNKKLNFLTNAAVVVVILAIIYVLIKFAIPILLPFIIALVIALLVQRPIVFLSERLKIRRQVVAPLVTLIIELVAMALVVLIIYRALAELGAFVSRLPAWFSDISPSVVAGVDNFLERVVQNFAPEVAEDFRAIMQDFITYLQGAVVNVSMSVVNWAATKLSQIPSLLLIIVISIVASFFMAGKTDHFKAGLIRQIPDAHKETAVNLYRSVWTTLWRMVRAYLLIMCITFCELALGLFLLGIDYFLIVAGLIALVDLLPVLGTGTILIPWALVELIIGNTKIGICLLVLYAVITVVRNIIEPKLVSRQIGLNPLMTLVGMYVGLSLFGILGMFLIPMLLIVVKSMNDMGVIHIWKTPAPGEPEAKQPPRTKRKKRSKQA